MFFPAWLCCCFYLLCLGVKAQDDASTIPDQIDGLESLGFVISKAESFKNIDYLALGYDIFSGFPLTTQASLDPGFKTSRIFDLRYSDETTADKRFNIPSGTSVVKELACDMSFSSVECTSESDVKSELAISASLEAGFDGLVVQGSFKASFEYQHTMKEAVKLQQSMFISSSECEVYKAWLNSENPPYLSSAFMKDVNTLLRPDKSGRVILNNYIQFLSTYGTHYIKELAMGARLSIIQTMKSEDRNSLDTSKLGVSAQAEISNDFFNVGASVSYGSSSDVANAFSNKVSSKKISTIGSRPAPDDNPATWAQQAFDDPMPLRYQLRGIDQIFTDKFMNRTLNFSPAQLKTIRANLLSAMPEYCKTLVVDPNICIRATSTRPFGSDRDVLTTPNQNWFGALRSNPVYGEDMFVTIANYSASIHSVSMPSVSNKVALFSASPDGVLLSEYYAKGNAWTSPLVIPVPVPIDTDVSTTKSMVSAFMADTSTSYTFFRQKEGSYLLKLDQSAPLASASYTIFPSAQFGDADGYNQSQYYEYFKLFAIKDNLYLTARNANGLTLLKWDETQADWLNISTALLSDLSDGDSMEESIVH